MFTTTQIKNNERGLLFKNGNLLDILLAGEYHTWNFGTKKTVTIAKLSQEINQLELKEALQYAPALAEKHITCVETDNNTVGLRFVDNILVEVIAPNSRRLYWKDYTAQRITLVAINGITMTAQEQALFSAYTMLNKSIIGLDKVLAVNVPEYSVGLVKVDGKLQSLLPAGRAVFWKVTNAIEVQLVDTRLQTIEVGGQEMMTKDKVGLRLNLTASWKYTDVLLAFSKVNKPDEQLYKELQLALRQAVGTRTLDELLENKQLLDQVLREQLSAQANAMGIDISMIGVKDIILPGEVRAILSQVVEAEKSAQANVIRRREETSATRSLLNTAKVMEDNPIALRLKELETLERIAERIDKISVFGGLDQVLNNMVNLKTL